MEEKEEGGWPVSRPFSFVFQGLRLAFLKKGFLTRSKPQKEPFFIF